MRVLIIDKQCRSCQSLKDLLDDWYQINEIHEAAHVGEALHKLEKLQPETILMDARVSNPNGLKAIRSIKAKYQSFTIIVLSMNPGLKAEAIAAGADAFIRKSDPPEKLRETLKDLLYSRNGSAETQIQSLAFYNP
jgi:DNA-binding NarL/FixJ family response regulator